MLCELIVEIAVISDTPMPRGGRRLPYGCEERLRAADLIVHAGDFAGLSALQELQSCGDLVAVHGNVEDVSVRATLPAVRVVRAGGVTIGLVVMRDRRAAGSSGWRCSRSRRGRVVRTFPDPASRALGRWVPDYRPREPNGAPAGPAHTIGIARVRAAA
jgi:hypothetical protein